jgi:hypothetical protein
MCARPPGCGHCLQIGSCCGASDDEIRRHEARHQLLIHHNLHTLWSTLQRLGGPVHVANKHVMELCALCKGCIWNLSVHNTVTW